MGVACGDVKTNNGNDQKESCVSSTETAAREGPFFLTVDDVSAASVVVSTVVVVAVSVLVSTVVGVPVSELVSTVVVVPVSVLVSAIVGVPVSELVSTVVVVPVSELVSTIVGVAVSELIMLEVWDCELVANVVERAAVELIVTVSEEVEDAPTLEAVSEPVTLALCG